MPDDTSPAAPDPARADHAAPEGPFESGADVSRTPAVQAVFAAFDADPGVGKMQPMNQQMLDKACTAAGVELGAYDQQILAWLASWGPHECKVIADIITRAYQAGQGSAVAIDMHRWYATVKLAGTVLGVIGVQGRDGLGLYDSKEEWEQANG